MRFKSRMYDYSDAARLGDIIPDGFVEKLGIKNFGKWDSRERRNKYIRAVFLDFLRLLIEDCIEHNVKFISPNWGSFQIYIREKRDFEKKKIFKLTTYSRVNLIESDGKIYEFVLRGRSLTPKQFRSIRIGHSDYMRLIDKVNGGKRYYVK